MSDNDKKEQELVNRVKTIDWSEYIDYGSVKVQVRQGKVAVVTVERTHRED